MIKWRINFGSKIGICALILAYFLLTNFLCFQGLDEEAIVDHGKSSFTTNSNYEKEDLESKFKSTFLFLD